LSAGLGRTTSRSGNEQLSSQSAPQTLHSTMAYENPIKGTPLSQTLDPNGLALTSQLQYGNDPYGRVTGQTLASGMSSRFTYWAGESAACSAAYTQAGSLASVTIPHATQANTDGRRTTLFHNASGQQVGVQVDDQPATCMSYDNRGRMTSMTVPAIDGSAAKQLEVSYGLNGNLFSSTQRSTVDTVVTTTRARADLSGRIHESIDAWGTTVTTAYDAVQRTTTQTTVISDAYGQQYSTVMVSSFDDQDRLFSVSRNGTAMIEQISYEDKSAQIDYGNGTSLSTALNVYGQLDQQTLKLPDGSVISDTLSLSPSGRILEQTLINASGDTASYAYSYDAVLRLSDASLSGNHPALGKNGYQWHYGFGTGSGLNPNAGKDGAVTQETVTGPDGNSVTKTFSYNYVDGLSAISASDPSQAMTVAYDASGYNMTQLSRGNGDSLSLSYDQSAQLTRASDSQGKSVAYTRNASGGILAKVTTQTDADSGEETVQTILYSAGWALNEQRQPISQTFALAGGVTVTATADNSDSQWQYSSLQSHALATTGGQGELRGGITLYSPYGEVLTAHPDTLDGAPHTGYDGASGVTTETFAIDINLMGDRIYIPSIHSFTTLDPTFNGGTSPYNYANADPINLNDPTGNAPEANILEGGFWDVNNPYMWILVGSLAAGVISGGIFAGYTVGFLAGLVITVVVAGTVGFFAGFTYGMITTDDDWGASATMGLIGMGYGAGSHLRVTATYA
ncbi:hypothetical protein LCGC14_2007760, partial [marine sediment metagenome]